MKKIRLGEYPEIEAEITRKHRKKVVTQPTILPMGDYTERLLGTVGITEDLYKAAKESLGLAPTCNCKARKEWLNRAGAWMRNKITSRS